MANLTNCTKNGIQYFRLNAIVNKNPDGSYNRKDFYGSGKKDAEQKCEEYKRQLKNKTLSLKDETLSKIMHSWIYDTMRMNSNIKPTTFDKYESMYRLYIKSSRIGDSILTELSPLPIQQYYNYLYEVNHRGSNSIFSLHKVLRSFFNCCIENELITKNPCKALTIPGKKEYKSAKIETFSVEEIKKIMNTSENHYLRMLIIFALGTGMRIGELMALKHKDITGTTIDVRTTMSQHPNIDAVGKRTNVKDHQVPKSKTSVRTVPISQKLYAMYKPGSPDDYIFTTPENTILDKSNVRKQWIKILKKADVPYRTFHCLRHTYITRLVQGGVPLAVVQNLAGHSEIAMTLRYTHIDQSDKEKAVNTIDNIFD